MEYIDATTTYGKRYDKMLKQQHKKELEKHNKIMFILNIALFWVSLFTIVHVFVTLIK